MATTELNIGQGINHLMTELPRWKKGVTDFMGTNPLTRKLIRTVSTFLIETATEMIDFDNGGLNQAEQYLKPSSLLFFVANHQSHSDILVALKLVSETRKRFPAIGTVYVPVSSTLASGRQNGIGQTFYCDVALPMFEQNRLRPLYVVTENDRLKRGVSLSRDEAKKQIQQLQKPVSEEASSYFVLPEGSVEGGKHNKDGTIKGMQRVRNPFLRIIFEAVQEQHREIICVPIGIDRTYKLLSAEHIFFTGASFRELIRKLLGMRVRTLAVAKTGTPFVINWETNPRELNNIIMGDHVAPLVPGEARGAYRDQKTVADNPTKELLGNIW